MRLALPRLRARALRSIADEELMTLVARRDPDAFEVLYDRHAAAAYSLAYRIVGNGHQAEDVTQDALLSIWRSGAGYDRSRGSVRNWTLSITRNRAIDTLRSAAMPTRRLANDDEPVLALQAAPVATETEVEALRRETATELARAVRDLPGEQSEVIALCYYGGFSQAEIARILGEPLGTVKGRMRLGLEKIRLAVAEGLV
jgi:RNA polymerase sigma-70 factor (ECF subfamily)